MDDSISPDTASDSLSYGAELPVPIDRLSIGGADPDVGDPVTFKVGGAVTRVVNETVYVRLETINDAPIEAPVVEPDPAVSEEERLRQLSQTVDRGGM
jgi:hypothetical protein